MKIILIMLFLICSSALYARTWTDLKGRSFEGELVGQSGSTVKIKGSNARVYELKKSILSAEDIVYLDGLGKSGAKGKTQVDGLDAEPGSVSSRIYCQRNDKWSYYLYLPKAFHDARVWPVWFIMSPGGGKKNASALDRYIAGAERLGCILTFSVESKNGFDDSEFAMEAMVDDVFKRLPVIKGLGFASGFSGGSRMAYLLAERDKRIAGVLACGSGSGVYIKGKSFRPAKLRSSTYIYSLIGTNCFNRTGAYQSHKKLSKDYRLRFFPGKHTWASSKYIEAGMARVLGSGLARYKGVNAKEMQLEYANTMINWIQEIQKSEPWETYYWASYLKDFPGSSALQAQAKKIADDLGSNQNVNLAIAAEKTIKKFAAKYFEVFYAEDKMPNSKRSAEADRLAKKFTDLPHGKLIKMLGGKS